MSDEFIQKWIPVRMAEMGFANSYQIESRTIRLEQRSITEIQAWNRWIFIPADRLGWGTGGLSIESNFGYFNPVGTHPEQSYEHTGLVRIENTANVPLWLTIYEVSAGVNC